MSSYAREAIAQWGTATPIFSPEKPVAESESYHRPDVTPRARTYGQSWSIAAHDKQEDRTERESSFLSARRPPLRSSLVCLVLSRQFSQVTAIRKSFAGRERCKRAGRSIETARKRTKSLRSRPRRAARKAEENREVFHSISACAVVRTQYRSGRPQLWIAGPESASSRYRNAGWLFNVALNSD